MTDTSDEQARARRAYELSTGNGDDGFHGPVHPDELARLERALLSLPRRTRAIFLAHRLDGHSYGHIAAVTGLSEQQVERHMASAIYRLDRALQAQERFPRRRWSRAFIPRWLR